MSSTSSSTSTVSRPGRRRAALAAGTVAAVALTGVGVAAASGASSPQSAPSVAHRASAAAAAPGFTGSCAGGAHKRTLVRSSNTPQTVTSSSPVSVLPNPVLVSGPRSGTDVVVVTFTAESRLEGNTRGSNDDWIEGVLTRNGFALTDTGGSQLALNGASTYSSNSITACTRIGRGTHRFDVRAAVHATSGQNERAWIDDYVVRIDVLN